MLRLIWASICGLFAIAVVVAVVMAVGAIIAWILPVAILGGVFMVVFAVVYSSNSKSQKLKEWKDLI